MFLWLFLVSFCQAQSLSEFLDTNSGRQWVETLTGEKETFNNVELLHLGKNSKPVRARLLKSTQNFFFITVPYWFADEEGNEFLDLVDQQVANVPNLDLRLIEDWSSPTSTFDPLKRKITKRLRKTFNGNLTLWNEPRWQRRFSPSVLDSRLHDKAMIFDGRAMIMGGLNVGNVYQQGGVTREGWHDTDILIEGPAVHQATRNFLKVQNLSKYLKGSGYFPPFERAEVETLNSFFFLDRFNFEFFQVASHPRRGVYRELKKVEIPGREELENPKFFPEVPSGDTSVRLMYDNPMFGRNPENGKYTSRIMTVAKAMMAKSAEMSDDPILIFDAYPTFTKDFANYLVEMAKRVPVILLVNSKPSHDLGPAPYYGQFYHYKTLLDGGVRIIEWQGHRQLEALEKEHQCEIPLGHWPGQTLHTKAMVFGQSTVLIGSHNFNVRSTKDNSEIAALINSPRLAQQMWDIFENDMDREENRTIPCGDKIIPRPRRVQEMTLEKWQVFWDKHKSKVKFFGRLQRLM